MQGGPFVKKTAGAAVLLVAAHRLLPTALVCAAGGIPDWANQLSSRFPICQRNPASDGDDSTSVFPAPSSFGIPCNLYDRCKRLVRTTAPRSNPIGP